MRSRRRSASGLWKATGVVVALAFRRGWQLLWQLLWQALWQSGAIRSSREQRGAIGSNLELTSQKVAMTAPQVTELANMMTVEKSCSKALPCVAEMSP